MMKKIFLIVATTFFLSAMSNAAFTTPAEITGVVSSFDSKEVKLYVGGKFVTVPRKAIDKWENVKVGNRVTAVMDIK